MTEQSSIPVGYVRRAHGIRGDVLVRGLAADASERFVVGAVLVTNEDEARTLEILERRDHKGDFMLVLDGVADRNEAEALVGIQFVIDPSDRRSLDDSEWWAEDLVGLPVESVTGGRLGVVSDVITGAAQDRLVVTQQDGPSFEVPFVDELVPEVAADRILVDLPAGLIDG